MPRSHTAWPEPVKRRTTPRIRTDNSPPCFPSDLYDRREARNVAEEGIAREDMAKAADRSRRSSIGKRRPEDVIAAAYADGSFMEQLRESKEERQRGIAPIPLRQIQAEERAHDGRQGI